MQNTDLVSQLNLRIAELEAELLVYVQRYGMTDEARRLFVKPKDTEPETRR